MIIEMNEPTANIFPNTSGASSYSTTVKTASLQRFIVMKTYRHHHRRYIQTRHTRKPSSNSGKRA